MITDLNTTNPLSFIEWKQYYEDTANATELSILYNNYLIEWKETKEKNDTITNDYAKTIYVQFLKNISLTSLEKPVIAFLERIDTDNEYELELSIHYFTRVIQDQLKNIKDLREEVKFSTTKNKLKTSKLGIQKYIKNFICRLLSNKEFIKERTNTNVEDINLAKLANNIEISFKNYITDEFIYDIYNPDRDLVLNLQRRVQKEAPNIIQVLSINKNGKKIKVQTNNISTPGTVISINDPFTDFKRLPGRYFRGEEKNLKNLKFVIEKNLIEKYLANDLYYLFGDKTRSVLGKLYNNVNPTNNLNQRYSANLFKGAINFKHIDIFPYQLSYKNTGTTNFYSCDLTFNVQTSAVNNEYTFPNPYKYESGVQPVGVVKNARTGEVLRNVKIKKKTPLNFQAKTAKLKNTTSKDSTVLYDNKILRNYGYQSLENSLEYTPNGINKREDNISFWKDAEGHIDWKNTDTYPISVLNSFPETERLEDLLINNKTGIKLRSDVYGNEFLFVKPVYPKRYAGTTYTAYDETTTSTTDSACTTAAEYYDGFFFNTVLSAITAAEFAATGTLYDDLTGMYDTFVVNDNTLCEVATTDEWTTFIAPLTDFNCSDLHTQALSCGSVSAVSAIDGGPFNNHPGESADIVKNFFSDSTVPYYTIDSTVIYTSSTTTYELSTVNEITTSAVQLFDQQYVNAGEIYLRNIFTQKIEPLSAAFKNVFNKHTVSTKTDILTSSNILDFDIVENTIYVQTSAETVTEVYKFEDGIFKNNASSKAIVISGTA